MKLLEQASIDIEVLLNKAKYSLIDRKEIQIINIKNTFTNRINGFIVYLSIGIKDEYLNEKDIDLFDIEFEITNGNNQIKLNGDFVISDGNILETIKIKGTKDEMLEQVKPFINKCVEKYNEVIKEYIN